MAHANQERYSALVDAKLRATLVTRDGAIFNTRYEGSPKAGKVKIPVRDTEVAVKAYDKANGVDARNFARKLPYYTTGTMYFGDAYFTRFVVQKTPYFSSYTEPRCELMLYSPKPYWYGLTATARVLGGYQPAFTFPVCYDSHTYGIRQDGEAAVLRNPGSLPVPFTATLRSTMPVKHPRVVDPRTGAFIGFDLTLEDGDRLEIYRSTTDRLACTLTREGKTSNIFSKLDEDSTLTELQPGDNVLSMQADSGAAYLQASVSFYPMEAGILPEPL